MTTAQIAPINKHARTRRSADSAWPIRRADGRTPAEVRPFYVALAPERQS
jgi:hypothetical protein